MKRFIATIGPYPNALQRAKMIWEDTTKVQVDFTTLKATSDLIDPRSTEKGVDGDSE